MAINASYLFVHLSLGEIDAEFLCGWMPFIMSAVGITQWNS